MQVGCLIVLFCKEYNVDSTKVMEAIVSKDTESPADISTEVYNPMCYVILSYTLQLLIENVKLGASSLWN